MKKTLIALLLATTLGAGAQEKMKQWEHNFYIGSGVLFDGESGRLETGFTGKVGYGLNCYFNRRWSLMLGADYRVEGAHLFHYQGEGSDEDIFQYIDVPITMQYHDGHIALGLAPVLSFCVDRGERYIDANPADPRNGFPEIKMFNLGLQPSLTYQWKHLSLGAEAYIGLLDVSDNTGQIRRGSNYKRHFSNVMAVLGVRF